MKDDFLHLSMRRHPLYEEMLPHWNFLEATYRGGRSWFRDNIFRYIKEGDTEYADRVKRAYRFNHTRQVVDLVDKYLFKLPIQRNLEDAPKEIADFWANATLSGMDMDGFARRCSNQSSLFGRVWVIVDSTVTSASDVLSIADEKRSGGRIYAYIVKPQDVLDMSFDDTGSLNWLLVSELARDDSDPLTSTGDYLKRYRLWTRDSWYLFGERKAKRSDRKIVDLMEMGEHGLGVVPAISVSHVADENLYASAGLIDDIAYLDRANANYLSNLDAIIQDQSFSQLTIPAQGLRGEDDGGKKMVEMGTKRIFTYDGETSHKPEYISPDPRQASMILSAIGKIVNEIYHSVGLSGERTKDDNGGGIDNASGVAKAYDFERVDSLLASKAQALQDAEIKIAQVVALWAGKGQSTESVRKLLSYPEKFDTRTLHDEFEIAARLSLLAAPDELRRKQMGDLSEKLFPAASDKVRSAIEASIKDWPPEPVPAQEGALPGTAKAGGDKSDGGPIKAASTQKTAKELTA